MNEKAHWGCTQKTDRPKDVEGPRVRSYPPGKEAQETESHTHGFHPGLHALLHGVNTEPLVVQKDELC